MTAEGHPFYVMEYLRGQSLGELLRREKRLTVSRTVGIISQVCEGLQLAHEGVTLWRNGATVSEHVKIVHRNLKPDNIFLVLTALGELVKILDFGIAKIRNNAAEHTNLTSMFIGTFHYAAPEQLVTEKNLDGRADIYSLGIILYEMLSGTDPFGLGLNINNISGASWVLAHTSRQPQPLRSQPGCGQIEPELEAVVMRCLQKAPDDRFAKVDELKQALQAATIPDATIAQTPPLRGQGSYDSTIPRSLIPSRPGFNTTIAQTPPPPRQAVSPDATSAQTPPPSGQGSSTLSSNSLHNNIDSSPDIIPSNSLPQTKSPLLLIGSGIAIALALTFGIYYLPQLSSRLIGPEPQPSVEEPNFSLANTLAGHSNSVWSVAITPDGQILTSGSEDKTIKIWSLGDGKLLRTLAGHADTVRAIAISSDGQTLVSGSSDKTIKIWRLDTGKLLRTLSGHADSVWSIAISPDGQSLASASGDKIEIWNLNNGKLLSTLSGHTSRVISIAISRDGQTLASSSLDKTIKIWGLGTGELLRTLSGHSDWVLSVAISPNGQTLASGSKDQTIKIWRR